MKIKFWKDNKVDGLHEVEVAQIIKDYYAEGLDKEDQPFERKILLMMADKYGSYEVITDEEFTELHRQRKLGRLSNEDLQTYYNNAMETYYMAGGHTKADLSKCKANEWKAELINRKAIFVEYVPDETKAIFNGPGAN